VPSDFDLNSIPKKYHEASKAIEENNFVGEENNLLNISKVDSSKGFRELVEKALDLEKSPLSIYPDKGLTKKCVSPFNPVCFQNVTVTKTNRKLKTNRSTIETKDPGGMGESNYLPLSVHLGKSESKSTNGGLRASIPHRGLSK